MAVVRCGSLCAGRISKNGLSFKTPLGPLTAHTVGLVLTASSEPSSASPSNTIIHFTMTNIHLLVIIHGMWGNPGHIAELARVARETHSVASSDGTILHVLKSESIRDNSTYDGVDWGGERVAKEAGLQSG